MNTFNNWISTRIDSSPSVGDGSLAVIVCIHSDGREGGSELDIDRLINWGSIIRAAEFNIHAVKGRARFVDAFIGRAYNTCDSQVVIGAVDL